MQHINEEQISAYVDRQLDESECRSVEAHCEHCEKCASVLNEMREMTDLFREAERLEPSPFLWSRIAANAGASKHSERVPAPGWATPILAGLRRYAFNTGIAAAAFGVLMFTGITIYKQELQRIQLEKINQVYEDLVKEKPGENNPFSSGLLQDYGSNPFSKRSSGRN